MALQYDSIAGLDISALASVTQAQLLQMVNQIAPLSNIGGIIYMSGAAGAHPDVTNNPRFARYLWLDTNTSPPIAKLYDQTGGTDQYADWTSWSVGAGGITEAMIANDAVALAHFKNAEAAATQVLRMNVGGTAFEWAAPSQLIPTGQLNPTALDITGLPATLHYLKKNGAGVVLFEPPSLVDFPATSKLPVANIENSGLAAFTSILVYKAATGNPSWMSSADANLFPNNAIPLTAFAPGTADLDLIQYDAGTSAWLSTAPTEVIAGAAFTAVGAAFASTTLTHSLGVKPRFVKIFARCTAGGGDVGYALNNDIPISAIVDVAQQPVGARVTTTTVEIIPPIAAGVITQLTTTNCGTGAIANMTHASWKWACAVMK